MLLQLKKAHIDAKLPTWAYPNSIGLDLYAYIHTEDGRANSVLLPPAASDL